MPDLIVTSAVLEESSAKLVEIAHEFTTAGDRVSEDADVWGQRDVTAAMGEFVSNWKIHRGKISTAVDDLQKKVHDMSEAWRATEQAITDGLSTEAE